MKRFTWLGLVSMVILYGCGGDGDSGTEQPAAESMTLPRIAIAGLAIESSTFSPARSHEEAFRVKRGEAVFTSYPFYAADAPLMSRADYFPALTGRAIPGGMVTRESYERMMGETLERLAQNLPYDGLLFDIHGAMSVEDLDDPEGDMIARIRGVVGDDTLISTSMDLHGNVSWRLAHESDLITAYRMAPHEDEVESRQRALSNLLDRLESGAGRPAYKAWVPVPILLPGEKTSTRVEPAKSLYAEVPEVEARDGVLDAAVWMGYPWADEPRNHAVVMVVGDDEAEVTAGAEQLAGHFWAVRHDFEFVAPVATLDEALDEALASDGRPFMISDSGDNPTAGGAGDVTWTLTELLRRPIFTSGDGPSVIYASIPDAAFVDRAIDIGVGGQIDMPAGAGVDARYAPPVRLAGEIRSIVSEDPDAEVEVVVRVGSVDVIVTKRRKPYHYEADFTRNGLQPREADIVMVKIGYLVPELYDMRDGWVMALTPGGVDQDLVRLPYERIQRPMIPFDPEMPDPDLSARLVPLSHID
jgi:microcystin degradation protein MlrC